jgi:hypothetical protein
MFFNLVINREMELIAFIENRIENVIQNSKWILVCLLNSSWVSTKTTKAFVGDSGILLVAASMTIRYFDVLDTWIFEQNIFAQHCFMGMSVDLADAPETGSNRSGARFCTTNLHEIANIEFRTCV